MSQIIVGCGNSKKINGEKVIVQGKLKNTNGERIVLLQVKADSLNPIDSVRIDDNGEFSFTFLPKSTCFYMLKLAKDNFINLLIDKGEIVEVTGNSRQLANEYKVSGSLGSELLSELNTYTRRNYKKTDSLYQLLEIYKDSLNYKDIKSQCDSSYNAIFDDQQKFVKKFIQKNYNSLASLFGLYQKFGQQRVLNERDNFIYFKMLDSSLMRNYPTCDFVIQLHTHVKEIENYRKDMLIAASKLDSGMIAPEISLKNIGGVIQPLSSLRGQITLLLFWESNSQPCFKMIESIKMIHKNFTKKGFNIYAVSLDKYRSAWENTVRDRKLNWVHVSDLLEWKSPNIKLYAVESIPYAILIDKEGKIVKRGITEQQLSAWLNKNYKP